MGHPAHFCLFFPIIKILKSKGHQIKILIKKKDVLENLLISSNLEYVNILPKGRKDGLVSIIYSQLKRDYILYKMLNGQKPNLMIGTSAEIAHIGKLKSIASLVINEDDFDVVPFFSYSSYPFATNIFTPSCRSVGRWTYKNITYQGYHELSYLHPNHFIPDKSVVQKYIKSDTKYFILRFSSLNAHHDKGKKGITDSLAKGIVNKLNKYGKVFITSERKLSPEFEEYRLEINPLDIHQFLYFAEIYIGDSQTMTAEAAVQERLL